MNGRLLQWYHRLPPALRDAAATLRGLQLRHWRYGPETDQLVEEAIGREHWTPEQWRQWRDVRLGALLRRAVTAVPHYRELWGSRASAGGRWTPERLTDWPILEKALVRAAARRFVADDCDPRRMFHEHTSGTSGTPLDLWWSRGTVRSWYALFEARCRLWYGVSRRDRWGILGGQLVVPFAQRHPPFWVWNSALHQLYLSSYHLSPSTADDYLKALERSRVEYLWGYTSALYALAEHANRLGRRVPMRVVVTNAEPVHDYQRAAIGEAFGCAVRETYGMAEIVAAASECEEGSLHLWPEVGLVEIVNDGDDVERESGVMVCTGLLNRDMPLIRYAIGDRAERRVFETTCACGRTLPRLAAIEGRDDDELFAADGRRIGRLDTAFKQALPIHEAQIIQESLTGVRVRYVPAPGFGPASARDLLEALRSRLGSLEITLEQVDAVPRTKNGKFRAVINAIPAEERPAARL